MTRQDQYDNILTRMHLPENHKRYDDINIPASHDKEDTLICMHLAHVRDFLRFLSAEDDAKATDPYRKFVEASCDSAIHSVTKLLDAKGWK